MLLIFYSLIKNCIDVARACRVLQGEGRRGRLGVQRGRLQLVAEELRCSIANQEKITMTLFYVFVVTTYEECFASYFLFEESVKTEYFAVLHDFLKLNEYSYIVVTMSTSTEDGAREPFVFRPDVLRHEWFWGVVSRSEVCLID